MARIDLIPRSWRNRHRTKRAWRVFLWGLAGSLFVMVALRAWLAWQMRDIHAFSQRMTDEKAALEQSLAANRDNYNRFKLLRASEAQMEVNRSLSVVTTVLEPLDEDMADSLTLESLIVQFPDKGKEEGMTEKRVAHILLDGESRSADKLTLFTNKLEVRKNWRNLKVGKLEPKRESQWLGFSLEAEVDFK
ncbi:MAG: hypothetical protein Q8O31_01475 [Rhodocyclaceae bacterium]|nr:hypothetical protein [Rhodocyclaceae bacterium]